MRNIGMNLINVFQNKTTPESVQHGGVANYVIFYNAFMFFIVLIVVETRKVH